MIDRADSERAQRVTFNFECKTLCRPILSNRCVTMYNSELPFSFLKRVQKFKFATYYSRLIPGPPGAKELY
jgi:hypothetical protein